MDSSHKALLLTSTAIGMLASAVELRVDFLGGWDKASIKQGVIDRRDEAVKRLQDVENGLFNQMRFAVKELDKIAGLMSATTKDEEIYDIAAVVIDETNRMINEFIDSGARNNLSFTDGCNRAIDEIEDLMFNKRCSREKAIAILRDFHKQPDGKEFKAKGEEEKAA